MLQGTRNAFVYSSQVRLTHSTVMALLFAPPAPLRRQLAAILQATLAHNRFLMLYVSCFKGLRLGLDSLSPRPAANAFLLGLLLGYLQNRRKTPLKYQVILYLMSRNLVGALNIMMHRQVLPKVDYYPVLSAMVWGLVMYLFEKDQQCLQPSLLSSMKFLYKDSDLPLAHWSQLLPLEPPALLLRLYSWAGP